ncbi:MAG: helix-turn-helix transcriptional regulator [Geodermatophilaceae bacterium]|nr:helix-turn-helix transcriptional regulator [Geodermatophilaceae bacterium]
METDEGGIGERIAAYRRRRGLTQEELAGLGGISLSLMKKIEGGQRHVTRFSRLLRFAQALRIKDLHDLTGVRLTLAPDGPPSHPDAAAVRSALIDHSRPQGERPALDSLAAQVERTWQVWQAPSAWRYAQVGQELPTLLRSRLYQLTRTWTKRVGEYELSWLAADRAIAAALEADDPHMAAAAAWNLGMILSAKGYVDEARGVVHHALDDLRPHMDRPTKHCLALWGGLHLLGASEAARDDRDAEAWRMLDTAEKVAARTGESNYHRMAFGPTNVAVHRVSVSVELGRTQEALDLAEHVAIDAAPAVERRLTHRLDVARAYTRKRNDLAAVHMIHHIHRESREELAHSVLLREVLRELMGRARTSVSADLRPLLQAARLPD